MSRVVGLTRDELATRERVFDGLVRKSIRRALQTLTSDELLTATVTLSETPSGPNPTIPAGALGLVTTTWNQDVDETLFPFIVQTFVDAAAETFDAMPETSGVPPKITYDLAATYLQSASNRLKGVGDLVWSDMRTQLAIGYEAGESITQLATRLRHVAKISEPRALTIARTEVVPAANFGSLQQLKAVGFTDEECQKEWLATNDPRTREAHRLADGQRVGVNQPFVVDGDFLQVPGDPAGRAENVINCRCSVAYVFDDDEDTLTSSVDALNFRWVETEHPRDVKGQFTEKFGWMSLDEAEEMHVEMQGDSLWDYSQWGSLSKYAGSDYKPINNGLRSGDSSNPLIAKIRSAMRPTTRDVRVKRAINIDAFEGVRRVSDMAGMIGRTFEEPAFLSTTIDQTLYSSNKMPAHGRQFILELDVPKGTPAAYLGAEGGPGLKYEAELLLDVGTRFVLTGIGENAQGQPVVYGRVVPR